MKFFVRLALVFMVCRLIGELHAQTAELAQLESALRDELGEKPARPTDERRYDDTWERRTTSLVQLRTTFSRAHTDAELDSVLSQIELNYHSEKVRQSVEKFRAAVRAEREAKEKTFAAEVEAVVARATQAVEKARTPADLDDVLRDLNRLMDRRETSEKSRNLNERIRAVRQFTIHWQDYLDHLGAGRLEQAERSLQDANGIAVNMIPRSDILARLDELKKKKESPHEQPPLPGINEIMAKTKTLADMPAAIDALTKLKASSKEAADTGSPVSMLLKELSNLQACYDDFKAGLPATLSLAPAETGYPNQPLVSSLVLPLKIELMRMVVPRFLRIDQAPGKDEAVDDFVARIMQFALERGDARLIMRVYELRNMISRPSQSIQLSPALFNLLAAQNQEEAGQFVPAVISYQKALRTGADLVPAKVIGARLEAIKASHPAEYDAAMKLFLAQPDSAPPFPVGGVQNYTLKIPGSNSQPSTPQPSPSPSPH